MLLDLSTVLFGALLTLLPIFAEEILKVALLDWGCYVLRLLLAHCV